VMLHAGSQKKCLWWHFIQNKTLYKEHELNILILLVAMIIVGLIIGWLAGPIWKNKRPVGLQGDYIAAIITAIVIGLLDWYVIPAIGFSDSLRNLAVAMEPFLGALLVLWIIRLARK